LLLFTAAIVSNIESVQQTLNLTLDAAYGHVFLPVEVLIWVRSLVIVLLIVAHAMRHAQSEPAHTMPTQASAQQPPSLVLTPELVDALRAALAQVTVSEEALPLEALPSPQDEQKVNTKACEGEQETNAVQQALAEQGYEQEANNFERVKAYLARHPEATDRQIAGALTMSTSTANKWRKRV
jgi:hypothetical protein